MARFNKLMHGNRDTPLTMSHRVPSAAAGTGTDYEIVLFYLPDLTKMNLPPLASGETGDLPINSLYLRNAAIIPEAALTGAATNYFQWLIRQYRAGAVLAQYTLSSASSIAVGANTIAVTQPAPIAQPVQNVRTGQIIFISGGTGTAEYTTVTSVSSANGTITFTAANTHSGAYTIVCQDLVDPLIYTSGINEAAYTPHQVNTLPNYIKAGDIITFQRQSFGTGLASPNVTVQLEFAALKNSMTPGQWLPLG